MASSLLWRVLVAAAIAAAELPAQWHEANSATPELADDDECRGEEDGQCTISALQRLAKAHTQAAWKPGDPCHTARVGEACYAEVIWAKAIGIKKHPEWYVGLTNESSTYDFQVVVYKDDWAKCPMPCPRGEGDHQEQHQDRELTPPPRHEHNHHHASRPAVAVKNLPQAGVILDAEKNKWCHGGPTPPVWRVSEGAPLQVKVLSYNLFWWSLFKLRGGNHDSAGKLIRHTGKALPYDFMGFQECESGTRVLAGVGLLKRYNVVNGGHAICSAYDKTRWVVLAKGSSSVAEDMKVRWYGVRVAHWMRLKHKETGRTALFVNHHGPLIVNSGGLCGGHATASNLVRLMTGKGKPGDLLILVGDFNANAASTTIQNLWPHLTHVYNGDSWGGVDNIFANIDASAVGSTDTLGAGGSDHNAISAVINVGGPGPFKGKVASEPAKSVDDLLKQPPGHDWQKFWCGKLEPDIEYVFPGGGWARTKEHMLGPDWCCRACQAEPKCVAWTWTKHPLKCLMSDQVPQQKVLKINATAGLTFKSSAGEARDNMHLARQSM